MVIEMKVIQAIRSNKSDFFEDFYMVDCYSWAYEGNNGFTIWI
jgi:hypothetical protein